MKKKVIISLHGIRTRGSWQKDLCPFISQRGWKYYPLDYGYFTAFQLLCPWTHQSKAKWFRSEYNRICAENPGIRPSIIVHSFGSLILAKAIEKYTDLTFDKIVLTGSIIRNDFPWEELAKRKQFSRVLNIVCVQDLPVKIAKWFVIGASDSGGCGFTNCTLVEERRYPNGGHSDSHGADVYQNHVVPFLEQPSSMADGSASEQYLALVSSLEAACWSAVTYKRQFIDRFDNAIRAGQFQPRHRDDAALECHPSELVVLIPKSAADASAHGREKLVKDLNLRTFAFGPNNERTALMDSSGTALDLPSTLESFKIFNEVHGNSDAVEKCLEYFQEILSKLIEDPNSAFASTVRVKTLNEYIKEREK